MTLRFLYDAGSLTRQVLPHTQECDLTGLILNSHSDIFFFFCRTFITYFDFTQKSYFLLKVNHNFESETELIIF